jgi:hypothetical protein
MQKIKIFTLPGFEPQPSTPNPVAILTELSRLLKCTYAIYIYKQDKKNYFRVIYLGNLVNSNNVKL